MAEGSGVFCEWRVVGCSVMGRSRVYVIGGEWGVVLWLEGVGCSVTAGTRGDTGVLVAPLLSSQSSGMPFSRNSLRWLPLLYVILEKFCLVLNSEIKSALIINSLYGPPFPNRHQWKGDRGRLLAAPGMRKAICQPSSILSNRSNPSCVLSVAQAKRTHTLPLWSSDHVPVNQGLLSAEPGASECWTEGVLLLKLNNSSLSPHFAETLMDDIFFVWYLFLL